VHLVPGCPAHVLLPLLVLFYNMFEQINNQSINQSNYKRRILPVHTGNTESCPLYVDYRVAERRTAIHGGRGWISSYCEIGQPSRISRYH